ncbi:hypothetical protein GA830_00855 [Mesorhizobium sp. NBSH29]|uniref:Csu type fimbrial protein n=1 Tax=Mesorhizobium sp. NBSH29 TaxID=2654249 RepID=UPI00189669F3|nr:spore coat protein U domain-containing protein [Mesorhizobium sp. NBSH29]QPC85455.1 hypothetical protein GA830_00855 [Mesorhizobium sp. NBSH29]
MKNIALTISVAFFVAAPSSAALAETASGVVRVKSTVLSACAYEAGGDDVLIDFGIYNGQVGEATVPAGSGIRFTCTEGTPYQVGLDLGSFPQLPFRTMQTPGDPSPSRQILYRIYRPGTFFDWGDDQGNDTVDGVGTGQPIELLPRGFIDRKQVVEPGDYSDTVVMSLYF